MTTSSGASSTSPSAATTTSRTRHAVSVGREGGGGLTSAAWRRCNATTSGDPSVGAGATDGCSSADSPLRNLSPFTLDKRCTAPEPCEERERFPRRRADSEFLLGTDK